MKVIKLEELCIKKPLLGKIIMIDPGHGGERGNDYSGINGLKEKYIVLKIAKRLSAYLEKLGAEVYLTRNKEEYVSLKKRVEYANEIKPSFFISLHMNAYSKSNIHGCEIYHFKKDTESEKLARSIMLSLVKNANILDRGVRFADLYILRETNVSSIKIELEYITNPEKEKLFKNEEYIEKIVNSISKGIVNYYTKLSS